MNDAASKQVALIRKQLETPAMKEQIMTALPPQVTPDRFMRVALTAIRTEPSLLQCDRGSLFGSIVSAAQLGLMPDKQLGEAYFVPFKGKVQMIPGYRGLLKLARQSGEITMISAHLVYEKDEFVYRLGDDESIEHFPPDFSEDRGEIIGAYAIARFKDGFVQREVMTKQQIEAIRKKSSSGNGPAWRENWGEMARKTVLRRLCKFLPLSTVAETAVAVDEAAERGEATQIKDGLVLEGEVLEEEEPKSKAKRKAKGVAEALDAASDEPDESEDIGGEVDPETGEWRPNVEE